MSISIQHILYMHPDRQMLFQDISFTVNTGQKLALIGNNGSGRSTLLRILAGRLELTSGTVITNSTPYYVPQHFGQYNDLTIAEALGISDKIKALHAILKGDSSVESFNCLNDDWDIEDRALEALTLWNIQHLSLWQKMDNLSGGEKTKIFLAGINIHNPGIILFDEPSNHLDKKARKQLYHLIENSKSTMLIVSHDRSLLNLLDTMLELTKHGITVYGGNYEFYKEQREEMIAALQDQIDEKEKQLRLARKTAREVAERKQKLDARGKKKAEAAGVPRIMMNTLRNKAEGSTSQLKEKHEEKIESISDDLRESRQKMQDNKELKISLHNANLHKGKILVTAKDINFGYTSQLLWQAPLSFQIKSGERIVISGSNGSGKSTLLNIILGKFEPVEGAITRADFNYIYIDQEYSIINNALTVFEQVQQFNEQHLQEHELKTLLHRFLFPVDTWDKTCDKLSGGEKMKLVFCCLTVSNKTPDVLVLDEPTNNLDIQSLDIITSAVKQYQGTLLLISHDQYFIDGIGIDYAIEL